jgi:hypothetical protein
LLEKKKFMKRYPALPKIRYVDPKKLEGNLGFWESPKNTGRPGAISISNKIDPLGTLETVLHELLHEYFRDTTEEKVSETAARMAEVLWREEYRKVVQ